VSAKDKERPVAALILAAGKGTRMGAERAKVLHRLHGITMLQMVLDTARAVGTDPTVVVVGFDKDSVIRALPGDVAWVYQKEQLGTGHAALQAENVFNGYTGDVLVLYGDVPLVRATTLKRVVEEHRRQNADTTLVTAIVESESTYGRVMRTDTGTFARIVEWKDASEEIRKVQEINTGLYCFKAEPLFSALKEVRNENEQHEYYLTDVFEIIKKRGGKVGVFMIPDATEAMGVDTLQALEDAEKILSEREKKA
jgi:bifunctional UDP-N-acetylglucosamine pyrophosphorylase/glucosamine-1-phosphate N-acetyltransferase